MENNGSAAAPAGEQEPDYGPRGYLPERAAKRARKIVLREQMGLGWPVAAAVAALLVAAAGAAYLFGSSGPPQPPYRRLAALEAVDAGAAEIVEGYLVVRAGGRLRVFVAPDAPVAWCPASGRLESPAGPVWSPDGHLLAGEAAPLRPVQAQVYAGAIYVGRAAVAGRGSAGADAAGVERACH